MAAPREATVEDRVDPKEAARSVGLAYVSDDQPGISRRRAGKYFSYRSPGGNAIRDAAEIARIRKLAVPPAYSDVWICPDPLGHMQATGRDAKGRKQYRYHDRFREVRDATKYEHLLEFAAALPQIRATIDEHLRQPGLPREKVLATVVRLLETTMIRVGNTDYVKQNKSYGLTTLRNRHVDVEGTELRFRFKGKSGKLWRLSIRDRRIAKIVKATQDLPGQHLFQYLDAEGGRHEVTSGDINIYLRDISGAEITAKDFRTWTGTVLAATTLAQYATNGSPAAAKKNIRDAVGQVASRLGNTPTVCRKCYIHPEIFESYQSDALELELTRAGSPSGDIGALRHEETQVLAFLQRRLAAKMPDVIVPKTGG
jgi:DNA topoisomerase I